MSAFYRHSGLTLSNLLNCPYSLFLWWSVAMVHQWAVCPGERIQHRGSQKVKSGSNFSPDGYKKNYVNCIIIYILTMDALRKTMFTCYYLIKTHWSSRKKKMLVSWTVFFLSCTLTLQYLNIFFKYFKKFCLPLSSTLNTLIIIRLIDL